MTDDRQGPRDMAALIARVKAEIAADITRGVVPATVVSFSELHDYVDANTYGGLCDDGDNADVTTDELIVMQDAVHEWLAAGRPAAQRDLGTPNDARNLSDVDVWIQSALADIDVYGEGEPQANFSQDTLYDEIARRWGTDALDRVATVITGGHFTEDDRLRWLRNGDLEAFMQLVRGERTPDSFGMGTDNYGN
jgi:hypothetical protein